MMGGKLPRFIIIGAAKAATTWIAHQLRSRPDVFLPGPEPHYFSRCFDNGIEWYASLFAAADADQLIGEKSADYLADPEAPRRIATLLPDVQLIVQLRNPVERAYSDYCMLFRRGDIDQDVARHLDRSTTKAPRFLNDGLYARHIGRYLDHFPRERVKIILHDDIHSDPAAVIADICSTLGIAPDIRGETVRRRVNASEAALVPLALRRLPKPIKDMVHPLRGHWAFEAARNLIARPVRYPPLHDDMRKRLLDFYHDDVVQLEQLLNRDLRDWTRPVTTAS